MSWAGSNRTSLANDRLPAKYAEIASPGSTLDVRLDVDDTGLTYRIRNAVSKGSTIRGVENLRFSLLDGATHHNDIGMPEFSRFLEWDKREEKVSRPLHTSGGVSPRTSPIFLFPSPRISHPSIIFHTLTQVLAAGIETAFPVANPRSRACGWDHYGSFV